MQEGVEPGIESLDRFQGAADHRLGRRLAPGHAAAISRAVIPAAAA